MALTKNQLRTLAGMPTVNEFEEQKQSLVEQTVKKISESGTYDGSVDFTEDLNKATDHLDKFAEITGTNQFNQWLSSTDKNFDTAVVEKMQAVNDAFRELYNAWNDLSDELHNAS